MVKRRFEVEWCYELPLDECGDADLDAAKMRVSRFVTFLEAVTKAKLILLNKMDAFGSVCVSEQERVLNPYITEDLGREFYEWETLRVLYVDDVDDEYQESDMYSP